MMDDRIRKIDGYRVRWLTDETRAVVERQLADHEYDGIGVNPYNGWRGEIFELLKSDIRIKALLVPFGNMVHFEGGLLTAQRELELLLLSEFTGNVHIASTSLHILRILYKPSMSFGELKSLQLLYVREPMVTIMAEFSDYSPNLTTLELNAGQLETLEGIERFGALQAVKLVNMKRLRSIASLALCPKLNTLTLDSIQSISNLEKSLENLKSLKSLRLHNCGSLDNLRFLDSLELDEFRCVGMKILNPSDLALARIRTAVVG